MAERKMRFEVIIAAVDKMSRVVDQAAGKAIDSLTGLEKRTGRMARSAFGFGSDALLIGATLAAPLVYATNKAVEFEDKMADVAKVLSLEVGGEALNKLGKDATQTGIYLGQSAEQAAGLYANLAQGGVAKAELNDVARIAGEVGVAYGLSADLAGEAFIKTQNALGATLEQTKSVTDAINHLSDNTAAKATQILSFMASGGAGVARGFGLAGQESAALGAQLIAMGKSGEESATIIERFAKGIFNNAGTKSIFDKAGGGMAGVMRVLEIGSKLSSDAQFEYFQQFGMYGNDIRLLATNFDQLSETVGLVNDQTKFANSVNREFTNRTSTTAFALARAKAEFNAVAIEVGGSLLPILNQVLKSLSPILKGFAEFAQNNPKTVAALTKLVGLLSLLAIVAGGLSFVFGGVMKAISVTSKVMKLATVAVRAFNLAWLMNPVVLIAAAIVGAAYLIWRHWEPISNFFKNLWAGIKGDFEKGWLQGVVGLFLRFSPVTWIMEAWNKVFQYLFGIDLKSAGVNIITTLWDGIKEKGSQFVSWFHDKIIQPVRDFLPFSPAKSGAFKDLHRVKIVETIAQNITPAPLVSAMRATTAAAMLAVPQGLSAAPSPIMGSTTGQPSQVVVNFAPTINVSGSGEGAQADIIEALREYQPELLRLIQEAQQLENRREF